MLHPRKQALFALLSLADLALTCCLLSGSGGRIYEANPLASWWLARHGLAGLACWKGATVLLVLGLVAVIARHRPRAAGSVLSLGCACLLLVVAHSAALCRAGGEPRTAEEVKRQIEESAATVNRHTRAVMRRRAAFLSLRAELQEELLAGRCTLREAAERLTRSAWEYHPGFLPALMVTYQDRPAEECMAANLVLHTVRSQEGTPQVAELARRFERAFHLTYGRSLPVTVQTGLKSIAQWTDDGERPGGDRFH
jgi:hypothetical protein